MAAAAGPGRGADGGSSGEEGAGGPAGDSRYLAACRACGVTPACGLLRRAPGPALRLRPRGLGPRGAKALALTLMVDTSVLMLDLGDNWLQGEGAAAVAEMLKENCYISAVDLSDNKLGAEGAQAISAMLLENTTVVSLQLSGNGFDDRAARFLADAITANSKVEVLDLSYNMFGDKAGEILGIAIAENIGLKELKISWNHFHSQGAAALAKGWGATRNPMQSEGCCGVLKALQANAAAGIEILDLPDIPVNKELAELCDAVKILFPNLLLRLGGNTKLQRKSPSKAELQTQPKVVGDFQNTEA